MVSITVMAVIALASVIICVYWSSGAHNPLDSNTAIGEVDEKASEQAEEQVSSYDAEITCENMPVPSPIPAETSPAPAPEGVDMPGDLDPDYASEEPPVGIFDMAYSKATEEQKKALVETRDNNPFKSIGGFRSGQIESWGRGIEKITEACKTWNKPTLTIEYKHGSEFSVTLYSDAAIPKNITTNSVMNEIQNRIVAIMAANPNVTAKATAAELSIAERNVKTISRY